MCSTRKTSLIASTSAGVRGRDTSNDFLSVSTCSKTYSEAWGTYFTQIVEDCGSGIADFTAEAIKVFARNGRIVVEGADDQQVYVFDLMGSIVQNTVLPSGIYMVKVGNYPARKVTVIR